MKTVLATFLALSTLAGCATARGAGAASPAATADPAPAAPAAPPTDTPQGPPAPLAAPPLVEPPVFESVLSNGLKIVVVERRGRPVAETRLLLGTGSASEEPDKVGVTWLALALLEARFEHMNQDDELLVADEKSARRQAIEAGGSMHFGVTHDISWLGVDGYAVDVAKYLQMLGDVIRERRHGHLSFAGYRDGLLDALDDLELGDEDTLRDQLQRLAFGAGHVYSRRVIGSPRSLEHLGIEDATTRQGVVLQPRGATLLVVGDVKHEPLFAAAARAFRDWRPSDRPQPPAIAAPVAGRTRVTVIPRKPATTTVVCAVRGLSDVTASDATLEVLAETLGNGRLRQALREDRGLTYGVEAALVRRRKARALALCTRLPATETSAGLAVLLRCLEETRTSPPSEAEVARARAILKTRLKAARDDVPGLVAAWSSAFELGRPPSLGPQLESLDAVTSEAVSSVARKVLERGRLQFLLSGDKALITEAVKAIRMGPPVVVTRPND